ncbi:hypothetical protein VE03_05419 [Pseudogymnoascus sp. 23342-1-I1]|nr:hypothetical protein VE03_05419 [Pseudogymnoascus sp. 23342-1-I1]
MTASALYSSSSPIPPAELLSNLHLASSPLDPNWVRELSNSARSRAYPSPPMSGSPLKPPRHDSDFDSRGRGRGGYGQQPPQTRTHAQQLPPQTEARESAREPPSATSHTPSMAMQYSPYQPGGGMPAEQSPYQYPPQPSTQLPAPPLPPYGFDQPRPASYPFQMPERPEPPSAAKTRKTKGHVAAACVPCKRAHLRCDAQRPCSRCQSNNKEDACIDMVHKKRGRPRLRDDHNTRLDQPVHPQPDPLHRRPIPHFSTSSPPSEPHTRSSSSSYRVLKSQAPPHLPRYLDHASPSDANLFPPPGTARPHDPPALYLTPSLRIARASPAFSHATGIPSPVARSLHDILAPASRPSAARLQRMFDDLRQAREPHYLPPIFGSGEETRVIAAAGMTEEDVARVPVEAREVLGFQGAGGEVRAFEVGLGLWRREGIFFVVLRLLGSVQVQTQAPMQAQMQMGGGGAGGGGYRADTIFGGQQQGLGPPPQGHSQMGYQPVRTAYGGGQVQVMGQGQGQQQSLGQSQQGFAPPMQPMQSMQQPSQGQGQSQSLGQAQGQGQGQGQYGPPPSSRGTEQRTLLLPPIRMREGEGSGASRPPQAQGGGRRRSSRVDIGGLIEGPEGR